MSTKPKLPIISNLGPRPDVFEQSPSPEEIDHEMGKAPWILRSRLTYEAYATRVRAAGVEPSRDEWWRHTRITDEELQILNDLIEERRHSFGPRDFAPFFVIREYGNKPRVGWFNGRGDLVTMSFEDFKNSHIEKMMTIGPDKNGNLKVVPLADFWLRHPLTRRYDRAEFLPGCEEAPEGVLNLWRGWPTGLQPGWDATRVTPTGLVPERNDIFDGPEMPLGYCDMFLEHMLDNMCGGDQETFKYLLAWMADALWNPGPCETAIILKGPQGSGKTFWAERLMEYFGPHALTLDDPEQVVGNFNKHLMNKSVILADEAFFAGNRKHAAKLKTLITRPDIFIEPKGVDGFVASKMFRVIMASNDEHIIQAERDDRRNLVLEVDAGTHNQDHEYFAEMQKEWDTGGCAALFRWLTGRWWGEQVGEGKFRSWKRPATEALEQQKDLSLSKPQMVIQNMLRDGEPPADFAARGGEVFVATRLLAAAARLGTEQERALSEALRVLAGDEAKSERAYIGGDHERRQYRGYWLPELSVCRERWERHLGRSIKWPAHITSWGLEDPKPKEKPPF